MSLGQNFTLTKEQIDRLATEFPDDRAVSLTVLTVDHEAEPVVAALLFVEGVDSEQRIVVRASGEDVDLGRSE